MERRDFLKKGCTLCMLAGAGLAVGSLASCATIPVYQAVINNQQVAVPTSLFATGDVHVIQPKSMYYNIALKKEQNGGYTALLLRCTHADNQLIVTGNGFKCNLHGSTYDQEGHVLQGPAERPLHQYSTEIKNDQIIIHLT